MPGISLKEYIRNEEISLKKCKGCNQANKQAKMGHKEQAAPYNGYLKKEEDNLPNDGGTTSKKLHAQTVIRNILSTLTLKIPFAAFKNQATAEEKEGKPQKVKVKTWKPFCSILICLGTGAVLKILLRVVLLI